ncbi:MAG: substrate-binding domain-containing protein [Thalassospira sp.]|uniref:substrate-binding domain-containing protein n=1 Tax=Thalassospira sp. TaxID=1912094 RepID=UPI003A89422D
MKKLLSTAMLAGTVLLSANAFAADLTVGVSWSNFQEERWKTDEAAIKAALEKAGAEYISADAQSNPSKQLSDIESLIARGADALIVLAQTPHPSARLLSWHLTKASRWLAMTA